MASPPWYTPLDEIEKIHAELNAGFKTNKLKSIEYRKYQLLQLGYMVQDNLERFKEALAADLGRPHLESSILELGVVVTDIKYAYDNVAKWAKTEKGQFVFNFFAMKPVIRKEAKGVILQISPFNYPIYLTLSPLVGALAAGNCVAIKPSEASAECSKLMEELIHKYLDNDVVRVINGSVKESTKVLELKWDHIMYTGGERVAKIVSAAAAKHLTPVTLELGGKSPVFIDPNCDIKTTARRLLWGKTANAGQTCVAPDYVLVPESFQDKLVSELQKVHEEFYPNNSVKENTSRIINSASWKRISSLLADTKGQVVIGGEVDELTKFIAPTVVKDVKGDDSLMKEEIFGPVLPIVPVKDVEEAIEFVNGRDHPLALYVFSQNEEFKNKVFDNTQSGGALANELLTHVAIPSLPFGGIGSSGSGYHTGKYGFDTFTHLRCSLDCPSWVDLILNMRYPPYTASKEKRTTLVVPKLPARPKGPPGKTVPIPWGKRVLLAMAFVAVAIVAKRKYALVK